MNAANFNKIIAVDFDGTLCTDKFPAIGAPNEKVIAKLKAEQAKGARVILWTCRKGESLAKAVYWCAARGIVFDAINENLKSTVDFYGGDTRKIYADEYWDDRAVFPFFSDGEDDPIALKKYINSLKKLLQEATGVIILD